MRIAIFDNMNLCTEEEVQRMLPLVSSQRREQALRYKHLQGRFCCLKSWLMLYDLVGIPGYRDTKWKYNEHGKPYLEHGPYFSISHCKEGIAVAVDDQPIGIDIEHIRHADADLIERVMNPAERVGMDDRRFTRLWTQKEAVAKWQGTGITGFEQLQNILSAYRQIKLSTFENEKYIYTIAYE